MALGGPGGDNKPLPMAYLRPREQEEPAAQGAVGQVERAFLTRMAELLHGYGTPSYRLEQVLLKVARRLGIEGSFFATPTSVFLYLGKGAHREVHLVRADSGEVDLGKLVEFDELMEDVEHGRSTPGEALAALDSITEAPPRYPTWLSACAFGTVSASAAVLFQGGLAETLVTFAISLGVFLLGRVLPHRHDTIGFFEPLAAFLVALLSLVLAHSALPIADRIVTVASLIVLLPGLTLTTGLTELATRHLVSGTARIMGAGTTFLTLLFGVALAWRLGGWLFAPATTSAHPLPGWTGWLVAALAPLAFAVIFMARKQETGIIWLASFVGYGAARLGTAAMGSDLGPFLGALVVGIVSNLYARRCNRPALVPLTPAILLLVPGSLGFRSLTSFLDEEALAGMSWAFQTGMVAVSLVGGLISANVVVPPRRVL